jgi:hypothetical protein
MDGGALDNYSMDENPEKCPPYERVRKQYAPPELVIYGSLRELTHSGQNDPPADTFVVGTASVLTT